jgi:predicted O-methyltransferase YrrM
MNIDHGDEIAARRARDFAQTARITGTMQGLSSSFFAHALFREAAIVLLDCDAARAEALADAITVLALADQRRFLAGRPIGIEPEVIQEFMREAGYTKHERAS